MNRVVLVSLKPPVGVWLLAAITAVVTTVATAAAVAADRAGRAALGALAPLIDAAAAVGHRLLTSAHIVLPAAALAAAVMGSIVAGSIMRRQRWGPSAAVWAMAGLAFAAQAAWLVGRPTVGIAAAVMVLAVAVAGRPRDTADDPFTSPSPTPLGWVEIGLLAAVVVAAAVMRFYALNRVPQIFEGELSPFTVGATDAWGMWLANAGVGGPWAPLGVLYYLPIGVAASFAGPTVLAVRLGSAVVSLLTVVLGAVLAREAGGRWAGVLAAIVLALDPLQIGWGRTDVHPHGSTAWPALLLAYVTLRMLRTGHTRWFVAAAALMALTWHQYPSGQFAVAVPMMAVVAAAIADRRRVREWAWRPVLLGMGVAGWAMGFSVVDWVATRRWAGLGEYATRLGPRLEGQAGLESGVGYIVHLARATSDLAVGIWFGVPRLFHQTFLPETPHLTVRALPWAVAALALVGLVALLIRPRRDVTWVLVSLTVTSALPAMMSDLAYVKRASVLYPTLEIIAATTAAALVRAAAVRRPKLAARTAAVTVAVAVGLWATTVVHVWFSGERYPWGRPAEEVIAEAVAAEIRPGDLVIASFWDHYMDGKLTYLLVDDLRSGSPPPVWFISRPDSAWWPRLAVDPGAAVDAARARPWYRTWSGLHRRDPGPRWTTGRIVYLIENHVDVASQLDALRDVCPQARTRLLRPDNAEPKHEMWLVVCDSHPGSGSTDAAGSPAG